MCATFVCQCMYVCVQYNICVCTFVYSIYRVTEAIICGLVDRV